MKRIIIHIGGHKTGSTAIQKLLFQNKKLLKKNGWLFPGYEHAHNTMGEELKKQGGYEENLDVQVFLKKSPYTKKIIDEINKSGEERIIISAEFFEHFPEQAILNLKSVLDSTTGGGRKYTIIYYCRRQDSVLESLYRETVKLYFLERTGSPVMFQEFKSVTPLRDYAAIIDPWAEIFGKENMVVQPYEKGQFNNNIFSDFFKKTDLELTDEYESPPDEITNIGLSADLTEFLRLLIKTTRLNRVFREKLYKILVKINTTDKQAKKSEYLSQKERRDILLRCEETNQKVAREYLGREDGKLFYEPWPDPDEPGEPYRGLALEEVIPILVKIMFYIDRQHNRLKEISIKEWFMNPQEGIIPNTKKKILLIFS